MTDFTDYQSAVSKNIRILRLPDVIERVGLKRASIYSHIAQGSFPKPISLGARAVGWLESEIDAWIALRIAAREVCLPKPVTVSPRPSNPIREPLDA